MKTNPHQFPVQGAGLGLRRSMMGETLSVEQVDFLEVAPENWIGVGGRYGRWFREHTERFPFVSHGLSLSIGSPAPLDETLVRSIKQFIRNHNIRCYSEHLSYCSDHGHLYDLLPIPFTEEAVRYVAGRIRRVQDILEQRIAMENVSYYAAPGQEMSELEFLQAVLAEADCDLLLDVNNIYVNAINHRYDAEAFLLALPPERIRYAHVAGHFDEAQDLKVDTHGAPVIDPVWQLLQRAYEAFGPIPTLLERDFNIPPLPELCREVEHIRGYQQPWRTSAWASRSPQLEMSQGAPAATLEVHRGR
ncbi:DUF692 domain-containing protein [Microbulbifer sp. ALW1]|uniref:HvfB family MNIO-type RiPP peptide maturase n=1 Tax=Microbulbifer sp. (strain ALW1) TaxID=1516059 RepID=UPI00135A0DF0|nr:DUF692 domain-containing protein [Microbulbifer sp. ALW1]